MLQGNDSCGTRRLLARCGLSLFASILLTSSLLITVRARQGALSVGEDARQRSDSGSAIQDEKEVRALEPGKPVERELAGGESHAYRIMLTAGEYMHVAVDQRGIDVVVLLRGPNSTQLMEMDGLSRMLGAEEVSWEAASSGEYRLEVRARAKVANKGRYEVQVQTAEGASGRDRARIAAQRLYMEGKRAENIGGEALEKAIKVYEEALAKWREAEGRKGEGQTISSLAGVYRNLSQFEKAREYGEQALAIQQEIKDRYGEGVTLNNLGVIYERLSEYEKALVYFHQALKISRELRDRRGEGAAVNSLGLVYEILNQYDRARECFEQALVISRELKFKIGEGVTLNNLGVIHWRLSQYEKAREYYEQALAIRHEIGDRYGERTTLDNLGHLYSDLSQHEKAREYFEQALAISRSNNDSYGEEDTLISLGTFHAKLSQYEKAREYYEQALATSRKIVDRRGEGDALYGIARVARNRGNLGESRAQIEAALAIIESLRTNIAGQELRTSYFASVQDYYELYVDVLMGLHKQRPSEGFDALALSASERARARSLLELLAEARANIRQGVSPKLLERERSLQHLLNAKADSQLRMLRGKHTAEQAQAAAKEITALTTEYQQVEALIRQNSPRYAALTQPQPLSLREIQTQVLDSETLLLEYSLGEHQSYVWAVTPTSLHSYELPERTEIETAARRVYELLTARNRRLDGETAEARRARVAQADAAYPEVATALSKMLLGPVASQLGKKRLLIVSDGALQYVPFAALPEPATTAIARPGAQPPLIVGHEIVSLPSASTLSVLRREVGERRPATKIVAVLADPVFDKDDERLKSVNVIKKIGAPVGQSPEPSLQGGVERTRGDIGDDLAQRLPRLYGTRQEATAITSLVSTREGMQALDFAANLTTATSADLSQYRIVHFATHGFINNVHPELSGIVLSLVDQAGQPQDGFLRVHEIFNLKLSAELVVLSACRTGLGKEVKGEGLIGLTRGFMYAGTPRVVVSLWSVTDKPTAEMMARFYKKMLGAERQSPAAALRAAQVEMWKERRWEAAYYWAAFILQGEWK